MRATNAVKRGRKQARSTAVVRQVDESDVALIADPMQSFLGYKLRRLSHSIIGELNEILRPHLLRPMDFSILVIVAANPGIHQVGIARLLGAEPPVVVLAIDRLQHQKHLERRTNRSDRRQHALHLTTSGRTFLTRVMREVEQQEREFLKAIGERNSAFRDVIDDLLRLYGIVH